VDYEKLKLHNYPKFVQIDQKFLNSNKNLNSFFFLNKSAFISFFINQSLDVPICFKKSYSLQRIAFELPLLKLTNTLMSAGKKEQILVTLLSSFFNFLNTLRQSTNNFLEQNLT
jgi:hypothetical protein